MRQSFTVLPLFVEICKRFLCHVHFVRPFECHIAKIFGFRKLEYIDYYATLFT